MFINDGVPRKEASKRAYKEVGKAMKLYSNAEGFSPKKSSIERMSQEFQREKGKVERDHERGLITDRKASQEKKEVWDMIQQKYETQKKKSILFEKKFGGI